MSLVFEASHSLLPAVTDPAIVVDLAFEQPPPVFCAPYKQSRPDLRQFKSLFRRSTPIRAIWNRHILHRRLPAHGLWIKLH
jgi:hypothetical protein